METQTELKCYKNVKNARGKKFPRGTSFLFSPLSTSQISQVKDGYLYFSLSHSVFASNVWLAATLPYIQ
jgi:hypothetical protein